MDGFFNRMLATGKATLAQYWGEPVADDAEIGKGGKVLLGPKPLSGGRFCVIEDPAGAVAALYQPA